MRMLYLVGTIYVGFNAYLLWDAARPPALEPHPGPAAVVSYDGAAGSWFSAVKPYCNVVEVEEIHRRMPPPATDGGAGFSAACYALAGKIETARERIETVARDDQWRAAGVVFNVAHPVADAGDDESAGPIMELVVEFWPNHYQALYHAGIARYTLGEAKRARRHLEQFLEHYELDDGFRRNAVEVLARLDR